MPETLMILNGANQVHVAFGNAVGAHPYVIIERVTKRQLIPLKIWRLLSNSVKLPSNYNNILCESCYYYPAIKRKTLGLKSRIINFNCGPLYYHLLSGRIGGLERKLLLSLMDEVDGHLVQGEYGIELAEKLDPTKPIAKTYPFISEDKYWRLFEKKKPTEILDNKEITIFATNDLFYKGLDIIIEAFNGVLETTDGAMLNICGNIPVQEIQKLDKKKSGKIRYLGFVNDITQVLENSSVYVMPSRGESFGVAALEAMAAGVPSIVSKESGIKELIDVIDSEMICDLDSIDLREKIIRYFDMSPEKKKRISDSMRQAAKPFSKKIQCDLFYKQFNNLKMQISP